MALRTNLINTVLALESSDDEGEDDYAVPDMLTSCAAASGRTQPPKLFQVDTEVDQHLAATCLLVEREDLNWMQGFAWHLLSESEKDFFRLFRINGETFFFLLEIFKEVQPGRYRGGRVSQPRDIVLLVGLAYLGGQCSYREIAKQYDMSEGSAHCSVQSVLDFLNSQADRFIEWPAGEVAKKVEADFQCIAGFPGVIGALDGLHIVAKIPAKEQTDYANRSQIQTINLMAVCDSNKAFTYINAGFTGSAHDRVLRSTDFYDQLISQPSPLFSSESYHILGDSAFPLSQHLLVPFKDFGNLSEGQKLFNEKLSATRGVIKNAYGLLRSRFRRLRSLYVDITRASRIIKACCVLHNISLRFPENNDFLLEEEPVVHPEPDFQPPSPEELTPELCDAGVNKRNMLVDMMQTSKA